MKPTIYFKFEKFESDQQQVYLPKCEKLSKDSFGNFLMESQQGFRNSQVVDTLLYYHFTNPDDNEDICFESINVDNNFGYIIPTAVQYHPLDWTDMPNGVNNHVKKSIFELIHPKYLQDMKDKKALLLIDQSVEGYSTIWLWEWFHLKCDLYNISPASIIYLTGDQSCTDAYDKWCNKNKVTARLKVIPSISLSMYINKHYYSHNIRTNFEQLIAYKTENSNNLKLFDCTNMRPRPQRVLNYLHLLNANLLDKGNISMSDPKEWNMDMSNKQYLTTYKLPHDILSKIDYNSGPRKAIHKDTATSQYYNYVERILDDMYKNSWFSIITESSYFDYEHSVFISEKTFKPIACMQPFIIVGSKHSLQYLRKLGYKTFSPYIDESYDELEDSDRFTAIIESIKQIEQIEDKSGWYKNMQDILQHNFNLFMQIGKVKSIEHNHIAKYYFEYFNKG